MTNIYEACHELFADYPLAAEAADRGGRIIYSMVLMLQDGDDPQFFILSHDSGEGGPSYSFCPWPVGAAVNIQADNRSVVPDVIRKAVAHALPIPRDGSLFGWNDGGIVTALTTFYTQGEQPPGFMSMPFVGLPETRWPLYASESLFGRWFWDSQKAGRVVPLADLIVGTLDTVFWVDTTATLRSGCCAVARDVRSPEGLTLQHGLYVYYETLRAGTPVPSLTALLAETTKIDLAPRFL